MPIFSADYLWPLKRVAALFVRDAKQTVTSSLTAFLMTAPDETFLTFLLSLLLVT